MVAPPNSAHVATLNPALGLCLPIVNLFNANTEGMKWVWIYSCLPFAGSILAVLFHEFVYKKM